MLFPLLCSNTASARGRLSPEVGPPKAVGSVCSAAPWRVLGSVVGAPAVWAAPAKLIGGHSSYHGHYRRTGCPLPHRAVAKNEQQLQCKEVH